MRQLKINKTITNRENLSLDKYLIEISKVELISAEEEVLLTKRIREGDICALEKLTKANLRFVVSVAKQFQCKGLTLGDLINEGNLGLIKAAQRFDETRGFKFISYAVWWIRQSIMQAIAEHSRIVRLPINKISDVNKVNRTFSILEQEHQREPTVAELADLLQISATEVSNVMSVSSHSISLNAPFDDGNDSSLIDILGNDNADRPDDHLMLDSLKREINTKLSMLTERESDILCCYYGLNGSNAMTLHEIGVKYSLTRERVRQLKDRATGILSRNAASLKSYL